MAINERGDIQYNKEVVLEKSEEETKSGMADWLVEEKEMGIPDVWRNVQCNEDVVLERKGERDRSRSMEEIVRQRGVEEEGSREDEELSKIRRSLEMPKMLKSLTKKGRQQCPQHIEMSLQVAEKELTKERPHRSGTKNSRNCVNISLAQRSVEWECRGHMPTIERRSASSGSLLSEGTVNGNRDHGRTDSGIEGLLISSTKVGKGV